MMQPPYLDPQKWIEDVKQELKKQPLESLRSKTEANLYHLPWMELTFQDLEDEIYGSDKPYSTKVIDMGDYGTEYDTGDFDFSSAFEHDMLPEVEKCLKAANQILGGGDFFILENHGDRVEVDFFFTDEEIPDLKAQQILSSYPNLSGVLASEKAFSDFQGPLFEHADVEVRMKPNPEGRQIPDPTSAKLVLPNIDAKEAEMIPNSFSVSVVKEFQDDKALVKKYKFTFSVSDIKFEPLANGQVRPRFKAELKEYRHA